MQFRDELIKKDVFPEDSGFAIEYPFVMNGFERPPTLEAVIERGDRYTVRINGHVIEPSPGQWWLDRSFTVHTLVPEYLIDGRNVLRIEARPFSLHHEPEPAYLLGDFALRPADRGFEMVPPEEMALGSWTSQGRPFYAGRVAYEATFTREGEAGYLLDLGKPETVLARIDVNGDCAGYLGWAPWRLDLTAFLKPGDNRITVTLFGSLKNLLGPHHQGKVRGTAWPGNFLHGMKAQPPGAAYDVIDYGLMRPFAVYPR